MRTKTMADLVGYDARLPHAADFLMWLRAASRGSIGRVNGVDLAYYRFHGGNMHMAQYPGSLRDLTERARRSTCSSSATATGSPLRAAARGRPPGRGREALVIACRAYRAAARTQARRRALADLVAFAERLCPESRTSRLRARTALSGRAGKARDRWCRRASRRRATGSPGTCGGGGGGGRASTERSDR